MKLPEIPVVVRLALLAVGATLFYTWVGQLVPQKEVQPPEVVEIAEDVSPAEMVEIGKGIFEGKGICHTCHTLGRSGALRFPDLQGIGSRAAGRIPGLTATQYLAQSLYHPNDFIVPGFNPGMPEINKPPIGLTDDEIKTVIAYLESLGGEVAVTMETDLAGGDVAAMAAAGGDGGAAAAPAEAAAVAASANGGGGALSGAALALADYGCTSCHYTDRPGDLDGPSLYDVGSRLSRDRLLTAVADHEITDQGPANLPRLTLGEIRTMVDYLAQLKGTEIEGQQG